MDWLRKWLRVGGHIVDSGANIGQMTLYIAPMPGVCLHAFEPTSVAGNWLADCVNANGFQNVRVVHSGLSCTTEHLPIQLDEARSTLRLDWYRDAHPKREVIGLILLDDYLVEQQVSRVRLWKLDVEGHELRALQGAKHSLLSGIIDAVLLEISEETFEDVKRFLTSVQYGLNSICPAGGLKPFDSPVRHNMNLVAIPLRGKGA